MEITFLYLTELHCIITRLHAASTAHNQCCDCTSIIKKFLLDEQSNQYLQLFTTLL